MLNLKECQKYKENPHNPACMRDLSSWMDLKKRKPQGLTGGTPTDPNGDAQLKQTH